MSKEWTKQDDEYVIANRGAMSYRTIANTLGRSEGAINQRVRVLDGKRKSKQAYAFAAPKQSSQTQPAAIVEVTAAPERTDDLVSFLVCDAVRRGYDVLIPKLGITIEGKR